MTEKPVLRCLVMLKRDDNCPSRTQLVTLEEAGVLHRAGTHYIVGPDPEDQIALAEWEIENRARQFFTDDWRRM